MKQLQVEERLDAMIDRLIKRLLLVRGNNYVIGSDGVAFQRKTSTSDLTRLARPRFSFGLSMLRGPLREQPVRGGCNSNLLRNQK
jgi:hypothetical protein